MTRKLPAFLWYPVARSEPTLSDSFKSMGFIVERLPRPCGSANTPRQLPKTRSRRLIKGARAVSRRLAAKGRATLPLPTQVTQLKEAPGWASSDVQLGYPARPRKHVSSDRTLRLGRAVVTQPDGRSVDRLTDNPNGTTLSFGPRFCRSNSSYR